MADVDGPSAPPKAYLFLADGERFLRFFFTKPRVLLGRAEDNDIVIREDGILPRHAEIFTAGPQFQLVAIAGSHTELNGERVEGVKTLANGDELQLGSVSLLYVEEHRTSETALNLIIQRENDVPFGVTINKPFVRVGRSTGDVLIDDDAICPTHLHIENFCEHGVFALDARSEGGTLLNGLPLLARRRVEDGDSIEIGNTHILVRIRRAGEARKARPAARETARSAPAGPAAREQPPRMPEAQPARTTPPEPPLARPRIRRPAEAEPAPRQPAPAASRPPLEPEPSPRQPARAAARNEPARSRSSSEPAATEAATGGDKRVRNTLRMPIPAGEEVAAPPGHGRQPPTDRAVEPSSNPSVVCIERSRGGGPEPLVRSGRAPTWRPGADAPRQPQPQAPPATPAASRTAIEEPQARQREAGPSDDSYHYLPGGRDRGEQRRPDAPVRTSAPGDALYYLPEDAPERSQRQGEPAPDRSRRTTSQDDSPRPPRPRRDDRRGQDGFQNGHTIAFPHPDSGVVDDGTDPNESEDGRYYHPRDRQR